MRERERGSVSQPSGEADPNVLIGGLLAGSVGAYAAVRLLRRR